MNRAQRRAAAKATRPRRPDQGLARILELGDALQKNTRAQVIEELGDRTPEALADTTSNLLWFTDHILERRPPGACRAGCAWCCYIQVNPTGAEIFQIAETIRTSWTDEARAALVDRLRAAWQRIAPTPQVPDRPYLPCPLLDEQRCCSVYAQRPIACRRWASPDAGLCERGLQDSSIEIEQNLLFFQSVGGIWSGLREGLRDLGLDRPIELVDGLLVALTTPNALTRWLAGEAIFTEWRTDGPR
jgi:hypothetical protein